MTGYRDHAHRYLAAGWTGILPLPPRKKNDPPVGYTGAAGVDPSAADVQTWCDFRPADANVALRLPAGVIGLDVDDYGDKLGGRTLAQLEDELGPLPKTVVSTSRTDGTSGIRLFRTPELPTWSDPGPGIEVIHRGWRYLVAAPSIHPDTGDTYRWVNQATGERLDVPPPPDQLPELPAAWVARLGSERAAPAKAAAEDVEVVEWLNTLDNGTPCRRTRRDLERFHRDLTSGGSRHDATLAPVAALVRAGDAGCKGVPGALADARSAFVAAVTRPGEGQRTEREAVAEWRRGVAGAYRIVKNDPTAPERVGCRCPGTVTTVERPLRPVQDRTPGTSLDVGGDTPPSSWEAVDPAPFLNGTFQRPEPSQLARTDGLRLLYPGRTNAVLGESESGKSWLVLVAAAQALTAGDTVLFLDFEADAEEIYGRLAMLGVPVDTLAARCHYVHPDEPLSERGETALFGLIERTEPDLVVIDGVTDAMGLHGLKLIDNTDVSAFDQMLPRRIAKLGPAVVTVDHVPKSKDADGKYAIGGQHKRAAVQGASYRVDVVSPFAPGRTGWAKVTIAKDRPGAVRQAAARVVAEFHLDATDPDAPTAELKPPQTAEDDQGKFRPTFLMERVSRLLEDAPEGLSSRGVVDGTTGRAQHVRTALACLVDEEYVTVEAGDRGAKVHVSRAPFRDEPGTTEIRPRPDRVPPTASGDSTASDRVPDRVRGKPSPTNATASPRPPLYRGTRDADAAGPTDQPFEYLDNFPPCRVCGEPTRDAKRQVHQRCVPTGEEGAA